MGRPRSVLLRRWGRGGLGGSGERRPVTERPLLHYCEFHCDGLDESITYALSGHIPLDSGPVATRLARSPPSPGSNAGWSRPLEALRRVLLCSVFAVCTAGYTSAMTFTSSPADTPAGPADDVVRSMLTYGAPGIEGVSPDWSCAAPRLAIFSAHAGGVLNRPGGLAETQPPCASATIHVVGAVATLLTRWSTLKETFR